ncbi:cytochrome c oxidase assembly protein [Photobacterium damselae subsp. piscicida]|uniref:Cytochrome c oxidase assembly protein CtaG n=1 Tax=Photobacterium damsela subsp. piscicida TaxID=38294 RepID=L7NK54_PHODP|nr:cytochrome c oxidase assembly protein [Photobacterium damselae]AEU10124.1 cytochrome C oxidase assembly protein [Photobacterium damselae subsp. piscicida]MBE8128055.1 cytochrome c oxidase assembly protein [Photobacterium damselae subsp. piscicida]MDP2544013.1 cytochrome c oxidase assembly protein [Photobacterium damselae subsp. piscicida]MDP2568600.1 cytochrome c oxidase assembly protein [Photobacterium damselae subsp. piscicida]OLQ81891.1 cytochrome c oxidase assembly protein [Photobacteri
MAKQHLRTSLKLGLAACAMFGFAFALVPLYDVFCDITGINGKTSGEQAQQSLQIDTSREVTVEFVAYISPGLQWEFVPEVNQITVHPGANTLVKYRARNLNTQQVVGQAIPSVSPGLAAQYLNKVECFCFNRQPLAGGESAELPLLFYVDPKLPDSISTLTLAYTLFEMKGEENTKTAPSKNTTTQVVSLPLTIARNQ